MLHAERRHTDSLPARMRVPHPDRLDPADPGYDAIVAAHDAALRTGRSTYADPATGYVVMTSLALLAQGSCCRSGCRHCPFLDRLGD